MRNTAAVGRVDLGKRSETPAYSLRLSPGQPPLSEHPVEGPTARRQLPWQPNQLPWRLLCVKDQSVGHGPRGLVRTAVFVPLHHCCASRINVHSALSKEIIFILTPKKMLVFSVLKVPHHTRFILQWSSLPQLNIQKLYRCPEKQHI